MPLELGLAGEGRAAADSRVMGCAGQVTQPDCTAWAQGHGCELVHGGCDTSNHRTVPAWHGSLSCCHWISHCCFLQDSKQELCPFLLMLTQAHLPAWKRIRSLLAEVHKFSGYFNWLCRAQKSIEHCSGDIIYMFPA